MIKRYFIFLLILFSFSCSNLFFSRRDYCYATEDYQEEPDDACMIYVMAAGTLENPSDPGNPNGYEFVKGMADYFLFYCLEEIIDKEKCKGESAIIPRPDFR